MILRTPLPKRPRAEDHPKPTDTSPVRQLVIYEDPPGSVQLEDEAQAPSDHMLCTYQCRQMVKADVLDALSKAEKQVVEYESKLEELNGNFSKAEAERKKFGEKLLYTEQELAAAKGRERSFQDQLLKEINDSQQRLKKQLEAYNELEAKLENEKNLRKKAESSAASAEEKASDLEGKLSHLSDTVGREKKRLNNDLELLKKETKHTVSKISTDLEKMECRAKYAEKESEILKEQLQNLKVQLSECLLQKNELEKKASSLTFQEGSPIKSDNILVKQLQEELRNYEYEVREARKLKSSHESFELLKEKLLEEKSRRERAESELSKLQELELNMKKLEDELSSWKLMIKDIPDASSPDDVLVKFASLQREVIDSMMKLGEVNAQLKQTEVALDTSRLGKEHAETEATLVKEKAETWKSEVQRLEKMLSTAIEEKDALKNVVNELKKSRNDAAGEEAIDASLLKELESSIAKKENIIKDLQSSLDEQKEINNRQFEEIKMLNDRLTNEARRIKSLERESDRLRSEISLLESKLGHGDYSAANTKVLRMVNTLAVDNDAKQTIEALRSELQKTKEKLQAIEELRSQSGNAVTLVDSHISEKITKLKEQIATLEKREERYKTVFADRISVFRRACCELFGYKIVMDEQQRSNGIPVTRFSLLSVYAQSDDEKLEFEYESGNTNILVNDYTSQPEISRQVDIFIRKMNSIPAFTANLTVESFNRRTLS